MESPLFSPRPSYWKSGTYATLLRIYTHCQSYAHLFDKPTVPSSPHTSANEEVRGTSGSEVNKKRLVNGNDAHLVGEDGCEEPRTDETLSGDNLRGLEDVNNIMELDVDADISSEENAECCAQQKLIEELENVLLGSGDSKSDEILDALPHETVEEQISASTLDATEHEINKMGPKSNNAHGEAEEGQIFDRNKGAHESCSSNSAANVVNPEKHSSSTVASRVVTVEKDDNLNKRKLLVYDDVLADGDANGQHIQKIAKKPKKLDLGKQISDSVKKERVKEKRGPLTKERKEKRKRKTRLKRAAKLREQGVKRLEIKSVKPPKRVCRHFLNGRCHEKESCKFSHDAVPLTKSKPCCHLATNSCLKGESCPYDHHLSKYPCFSLSTKGYCSRGKSCLFSHDITRKTDDAPVGNGSKLSGHDKQLNCAPEINTPKSTSIATSLASSKLDLFSKEYPQMRTVRTPSPLGGINFLAFCKPKTAVSTQEQAIPTTNDAENKNPFSLSADAEKANPFSFHNGAQTDEIGMHNKDLLDVRKSPNSAQRAMMSMKAFAAKVESTMKPI